MLDGTRGHRSHRPQLDIDQDFDPPARGWPAKLLPASTDQRNLKRASVGVLSEVRERPALQRWCRVLLVNVSDVSTLPELRVYWSRDYEAWRRRGTVHKLLAS